MADGEGVSRRSFVGRVGSAAGAGLLIRDVLMAHMSGKFRGRLSENAIKSLCRERGGPIVTAVEVAEEFGVTQQAAHQQLTEMHENGEMERRKVGSRAVVWWPDDN